MVDPIALYHQLCVEYENWLERAKARNERDLVFGLRHANVLAQSFIHLPAVEVEEGRTSLGCRKPRCFPRSINNSLHHHSRLAANFTSTKPVSYIQVLINNRITTKFKALYIEILAQRN